MSGSNALTIPRDPTVLVNPLSAIDAGVKSAGTLMDVQSKQGEQLVGQALQQATDPTTGVLDTQKAQRIAASMGPNAAFAMQGFLKTGSQLRGEQIIQAGNLYGVAGRLAASAAGDPSDENMAKIRAQGVALGLPPSGLAEIDRISALPVDQRSAEALKHTLGAIDALQRMHYQQGGAPTSWETGGGYQGGTYDPVTGALRPAGPTVNKTLTPGEATGLDKIDRGDGTTIQVPHEQTGDLLRRNPGWRAIVTPSGSPGSSTTPPPPPASYVARPAPAAPAAPAVAPAAPGGPGTYQGSGFGVLPGPGASLSTGGVNVASANPSFAPTVGAAAPPSPAVAGDVNAILAGINQRRGVPSGGTQEAFNALQNGGVSGVAPPAAAPARPAVVAPAAAAPPAPPAPALGISAPPGKVEAGQETGKQSAIMGGDLIKRGDQAPVQKANLENMLTDLAKLDSMGPGTEKEIFLNSVMQKLTGYNFSMNRDQVAAGNSFAKLANIAVGQQLAAIGGTDQRQALFMGSNPHLDMSKLGNERIIQMLKGNEDAIQAKARAWQTWSSSKGSDTYQAFQDDFNRHFDPRVFQSQYMAKGGPELAALRASLEREGTGAVEKFKADTNYARDNRWIQ